MIDSKTYDKFYPDQRHDGTLRFYKWIRKALRPEMTLLNLGAGPASGSVVEEFSITLADLGGAAKKPGTRKSVAAKYRYDATGETWSGRGRPPRWLADELAKGRKREEFLIR